MKVTLSIVIPCFNVEFYVKECIESIIKSQYKSKLNLREEFSLEVIIINDGSSDNTEEAVLSLMDKHSGHHIRYYKKENGGQSSARNMGLGIASGEFVWFLDSDDFITLDALSVLYNTIKNSDSDFILFSAIIQNETINYIPKDLYSRYKGDFGQTPLNYLLETFNMNAFIASPCLYVLRKNLLVKNKIKFLNGLIWEDELFTRQCFLNSRKFSVLEASLYVRRFRENSTTQMIYKPLHVYSFFGISNKVLSLNYVGAKNHGKFLYGKGLQSLKRLHVFSFKVVYYFMSNKYSWNLIGFKNLASYVKRTAL